MTVKVRLIADDLTGALDTGVCFAGSGGAPTGWSGTPDDAELVHSIESRDLSPDQASARAARTADWLLGAALSFKKIDSRLRGNVAAELQAVLQTRNHARPLKRLLIAPSLEAQGRVMSGGQLWSYPSSSDPVPEPVDLAADLAALGIPVSRMTPDAVLKGVRVPDGVSLWDAANDADLDIVAAHGLKASGPTLWCGSAGLAGALARQLGFVRPLRQSPRRPLLMLVGTRHPRTIAQVDRLRDVMPDSVVAIGPDGEGAAELGLALEQGHTRLAFAAPSQKMTVMAAARHVASAIHRLAQLPAPATAFVAGGATLMILNRALGTRQILLDGVHEPGAPAGRFSGGRWGGVQLISRSGGFGDADFLVELADAAGRAIGVNRNVRERF